MIRANSPTTSSDMIRDPILVRLRGAEVALRLHPSLRTSEAGTQRQASLTPARRRPRGRGRSLRRPVDRDATRRRKVFVAGRGFLAGGDGDTIAAATRTGPASVPSSLNDQESPRGARNRGAGRVDGPGSSLRPGGGPPLEPRRGLRQDDPPRRPDHRLLPRAFRRTGPAPLDPP